MLKRKNQYLSISIALLSIFVLLLKEPLNAQTSYTQSGGIATKTNETFNASSTNESGVLVKNSGTLIMTNCSVTTSGNTSSGDSSSFYGLNAGVLTTSKSTITITGGTITTTGIGANGIFVYGTGASVNISDVTIHCSGRLGHAVMCSGNGTMTVTNVNMTTVIAVKKKPLRQKPTLLHQEIK